ncbi:PLAC8 family-domain-containing protein [Xylaria longipes]|nr:PLAC8 family-domain-containing protein [Xylaria longipes]
MATPEKYGQEQGVYGQAPIPQQQPYAHSAPMAANHQSHGHLEKDGSEWQTGICNCEPCSSCLLGWCLPCLLLGQTSERIRDPSMQSADMLNSDCLIYTAISCFTGCGWIYAMIKRGEIRERYGIKGSGCDDCCVSYWVSEIISPPLSGSVAYRHVFSRNTNMHRPAVPALRAHSAG